MESIKDIIADEYDTMLEMGKPQNEESVRLMCKGFTLNTLFDFMCIVHMLGQEAEKGEDVRLLNRIEGIVFSEAMKLRHTMTEEEAKSWLNLSIFNTEPNECN